jgi:hypothetical protein
MKSLFCLTTLVCIFSTSLFATTTPAQKPAAPAKPAAVKPALPTINLYATPESNSKIIEKLPANADLVGIYHQGDWIKVGDRHDGTTGWVNEQQYNQAKQNYYQQQFHSVINTTYINVTKNKDGKTVIEAYKNGKKLSEADAKKLYAQMQAQGKKQWQAMQHFNAVMDQQMQKDYLDARRAMDEAFSSMPSIVIIQHPAQKEENAKSDKK